MYVWVWLGHRVFLTWEMIMFFKLFIKYFYFPSCSGGTVSIHHSFTLKAQISYIFQVIQINFWHAESTEGETIRVNSVE